MQYEILLSNTVLENHQKSLILNVASYFFANQMI